MARSSAGPHSPADVLRFQQALRARHTARKGSGPNSRGNWARPLQYDESGFPIRTDVPSFTDRVRRLLRSD
jgi:hypothetical protein